MSILKNKIILFINRFSQYAISGFYFWIFLIRGGIIYGFVPAAIGLIKCIHEIQHNDEQSLKTIYAESYKQNKHHKGLSFTLFILLGLSIMSLCIPLFSKDPIIGFFQLPLIIFTCILWTISIYYVYFLSEANKKKGDMKWIAALSFVTCIKHPLKSLIILITMLVLCFLIKINLVIFIFFVPPIFILSTNKIVTIPSVLKH